MIKNKDDEKKVCRMDIMYIRKKQLETFFKETMDFVIVATKIEERSYYAIQAMTAGFQVLCEKPVEVC